MGFRGWREYRQLPEQPEAVGWLLDPLYPRENWSGLHENPFVCRNHPAGSNPVGRDGDWETLRCP